MVHIQGMELSPETKALLPPMSWANQYVCPKGHFYDHFGHASNPSVAWVATWCNECEKETGEKAFYGRDEWTLGAERLLAIATSINTELLKQRAYCQVCGKTVAAKNDKAFHLQSHFSKAITQEDSKFIVAALPELKQNAV